MTSQTDLSKMSFKDLLSLHTACTAELRHRQKLPKAVDITLPTACGERYQIFRLQAWPPESSIQWSPGITDILEGCVYRLTVEAAPGDLIRYGYTAWVGRLKTYWKYAIISDRYIPLLMSKDDALQRWKALHAEATICSPTDIVLDPSPEDFSLPLRETTTKGPPM